MIAEKVLGFLIIYKLYIRMRIRDAVVEEQVQWMQLYMQGELANTWKENIIEDLESESLVYIILGEFLIDLEQKIGRGNNETMKVVELKKIE